MSLPEGSDQLRRPFPLAAYRQGHYPAIDRAAETAALLQPGAVRLADFKELGVIPAGCGYQHRLGTVVPLIVEMSGSFTDPCIDRWGTA